MYRKKYGLVIIGILICSALYVAMQNQQFVPPIPRPTPAPVVPDLPDITAYLAECKSLCEGQVKMAKQHVRAVFRGRVLGHGQTLYNSAKAKFDGCITYLQTAMARRFSPDDPAVINQKLKSAEAAMNKFIGWYDTPADTEGCCAAAGPGDWEGPTLNFINDWINGTRQENEAAIDRISKALDACRFRDWDEL